MDSDFTPAETFKIDLLQWDLSEFCRSKGIKVMVISVLIDSPSEPSKIMQISLSMAPPHIHPELHRRLTQIRRKLNEWMLSWNIQWGKDT